MALKHWKKITSEVKFKNPWWTYIVDKYLIDEAREGEYHYCHTEGSAFVIPVMDDGRILMVNQYRYLNDMESLEFPGGGVKPGETARATFTLRSSAPIETNVLVGDISWFAARAPAHMRLHTL